MCHIIITVQWGIAQKIKLYSTCNFQSECKLSNAIKLLAKTDECI